MSKKTIAVALTLLVLFVVGSVIAAPRMEIKEQVFDFGYAPQNSKLSHVFWLYSTGDDTLKILKVKPGWGCTKAPLEKTAIAVGDSTKLEIIFSSKKYRTKITKSPKITTNEGGTTKMVRIITTVIERPDSTYPVINTPYKLDMSQFTGKKVDHKKLKITNVSDEDLQITLVAYAEEYFEVDLPKSVGVGETVEGEIILNEDALEKSFTKSFTFELSDEKNSRFSIPVKRTVRNLGTDKQAKSVKGK